MKRKKYINERMKQMCVYHILAIVACVARHWNVIEYANVLKSIFAHHNIFLDFKLINCKSFTLRYYIFIIASKSYLFWNNKDHIIKKNIFRQRVLYVMVEYFKIRYKLVILIPNSHLILLYMWVLLGIQQTFTHTSKHIYQTTHTFK